MPLLPKPRRLKRGPVWYGKSRFAERGWFPYNTHCTTKRAAAQVVSVVEAYCYQWQTAKRLLDALRGLQDAQIIGLVETMRAQFHEGRNPFITPDCGETIEVLFTRFIGSENRNWSKKSADFYRSVQEAVSKAFGDVPLKSVGRRHRDALVDFLNARGAILRTRDGREKRLGNPSPHTVNRYIRCVVRFLNWCEEEELLPDWHPPRFKQVKADSAPRRETFTPEELESILTASESFRQNGQPVKLYFAFLAYSGFRRNEALSLTWRDVDRARGTIAVPVGKTGRRDVVPLTGAIDAILTAIGYKQSGRVFPALSEEVSDTFKQVCKAASVDYRPLHRLRATYATQLSASGVTPMSVQRLARHKKIETTHDWYFQPTQDALRREVDRSMEEAPFETALKRVLSK